jgi:amino acid transporter
MNAVNTAVFAFTTTPYFFNIIGEMRNPRDFTKTALTSQAFVTATYLTISVVIYHFVSKSFAEDGRAGVGKGRRVLICSAASTLPARRSVRRARCSSGSVTASRFLV